MVDLFNTKTVTIGTDIIREGWLEKESRYRKVWRRRWCVLTPLYFCTFEEEKNYSNATEIIDIDKIRTVKTDEVKSGFFFKIQLDDRVYVFKAKSFEEKEGWIGSLNKAMIKISKSNINAENN